MTLALDRVEIERVGSDPVRLAVALLKQLPELSGAVPIEDIAHALDIVEIASRPLNSLEGCLQCDPLKSYGQIVVNARNSPRRRRYTVAHELGHFLNEKHLTANAFGVECTPEDMSAPRRKGIRLQRECEADRFAIEVLTPRQLIARYLKPAAHLEHALSIAKRFEVSREAAIRRYVARHDECLAAVFSENGRIRYVEKGPNFPMTLVWNGDRLPGNIALSSQAPLTSLDEADAAFWLKYPGAFGLFAQMLFQDNGFATTLLVAERGEDADEDAWTPPRFRR